MSTLIDAIKNGDKAKVEELLSNKSEDDIELIMNNIVKYVDIDIDVVNILIKKIDDINKLMKNGDTLLIKAIKNKNGKLMKALIDAGADVNKTGEDGNTPLIHAIKNKFLFAIKKLFKRGADINKINDKKETPLEIALKENNEDAVKYLIEKGCEIGKIYKNLLDWVLTNNHKEILRKLLVYEQRTFKELAIKMDKNIENNEKLQNSIKSGRTTTLKDTVEQVEEYEKENNARDIEKGAKINYEIKEEMNIADKLKNDFEEKLNKEVVAVKSMDIKEINNNVVSKLKKDIQQSNVEELDDINKQIQNKVNASKNEKNNKSKNKIKSQGKDI